MARRRFVRALTIDADRREAVCQALAGGLTDVYKGEIRRQMEVLGYEDRPLGPLRDPVAVRAVQTESCRAADAIQATYNRLLQAKIAALPDGFDADRAHRSLAPLLEQIKTAVTRSTLPRSVRAVQVQARNRFYAANGIQPDSGAVPLASDLVLPDDSGNTVTIKLARRAWRKAIDWNPDDHPRDADGKFTGGGGGDGASARTLEAATPAAPIFGQNGTDSVAALEQEGKEAPLGLAEAHAAAGLSVPSVPVAFVQASDELWTSPNSGSQGRDAIQLQAVVADKYGLAVTSDFQAAIDATTGTGDENDWDTAIRSNGMTEHRAAEGIVSGMYANTQKVLEEQGVDSVMLYRGIAFERSDAPAALAAAPAYDGTEKGWDTLSYTERPLSSWSTDPNKAVEFASAVNVASGGSPFAGKPAGYVLAATVPRDRIFANARTGFGSWAEHEWVVIGGKMTVGVTNPADWVAETYYKSAGVQRKEAEWDADQHPRDENGRFTETGGGVEPAPDRIVRDAATLDRETGGYSATSRFAATDRIEANAPPVPNGQNATDTLYQYGRAWTDGSSRPPSLHLQAAVADKFGLEVSGQYQQRMDAVAGQSIGMGKDTASTGAVAAWTADAVYDDTQRFLSERGTTDVTLYRAISFAPGETPEALRGVPAYDGTPNGWNTMNYLARPLSSWTLDPHIALDYTDRNAGDGFVMAAKVPAGQVFSTPYQGIGTDWEHEYVIIGGRQQVAVTRPSGALTAEVQVNKSAAADRMRTGRWNKDGTWNEDQHPRDERGRFTDSGGGSDAPSMSDPSARGAYVEQQVAAALQHGLDTETQYDKLAGKDGAYTPERTQLHRDIVNDHLAAAAGVPSDRQALILGGLGGAGKTTALKSDMGRQLGVEMDGSRITNYVNVNPDDIKEELVNRGAGVKVDDLSPMECSGLLHEESSGVAKQIASTAISQGKNVVWDITMSSSGSVASRIAELKDNGYTVRGAFIDVSTDRSTENALGRWQRGQSRYESGQGAGGRYVSPSIIAAQRDPQGQYRSVNRSVFEQMKPQFSDWYLVDNEDKTQRIVATGHG